MVLGVRVAVYGGGQFEIVGAVADYSRNMGGSLLFKVEPLPYTFYFHLLAPNYTPVTTLPSASIKDYFRLGSVYLLIESFGGVVSPRYTVEFVSQYISIITYEVYVTTERERISLEHQNCVTHLRPYVLITQLFALAPVSSLV